MQICPRPVRNKDSSAFTLAEILVASAIVGMLVLGNMATIYGVRLMSSKDFDRGVVSGFLQHYAELLKALPFDQVRTNMPLAGLYSGLNNTPRVVLPSNQSWFNINNTNYQTFHPSLVVLTNRAPQMRVIIETAFVGTVEHDKHVSLEVRWNPPLGKGAQMVRRLDLVRVKDL